MFEISDVKSKHIFETQKDKDQEEVKVREPEQETKTNIEVKRVCLSLIN